MTLVKSPWLVQSLLLDKQYELSLYVGLGKDIWGFPFELCSPLVANQNSAQCSTKWKQWHCMSQHCISRPSTKKMPQPLSPKWSLWKLETNASNTVEPDRRDELKTSVSLLGGSSSSVTSTSPRTKERSGCCWRGWDPAHAYFLPPFLLPSCPV